MDHRLDANPGLTIAIGMAAGLVAQSLARHLRIPGIVVLLATGMLLGPDVAGLVHPEALGSALHVLVGFAVAVILLEGGMHLSFEHLSPVPGPLAPPAR